MWLQPEGVILFWELLHNPGQHGRRHSILQMLEIQFFSEVGSGIPLQGLLPPRRGKGYNGTYNNLIVYMNYPRETPILDCSNFPSSTTSTSGFNAENVTYVKFKGLTIRNVRQTTNAQYIVGAGWTNSGVIYLENVTSTGHGGAGIRINTYDTLYLTNCDSYNIDPTTTSTIPRQGRRIYNW